MSHQNNNDPLSKENLGKAQESNLNFIEEFTVGTITLCNVPVLQVLSYEFIQILNNMYLQEILGDEEETEENTKKVDE